MGLKLWSAFYPDILPSVPGCPNPVVDTYLRKAAIDLCQVSRRLKVEVDTFSTVVGTQRYDVDMNSGTELVEIDRVTLDGSPISPATMDEIAYGAGWNTDTGKPSVYAMSEGMTEISFWSIPDAVYTVAIAASIKPTRTATGIESWFADAYWDGIVSGALSGLLAMPGNTWTNLDLAAARSGLYATHIRRASAHDAKSGTRAPLRSKVW